MEQQAWILRSFLAQLERQEAADEEASNGIAGEFTRLKCLSIRYRTDKIYPTKRAEKQENIKKNRYKDIVPFDHSRVKLTLTTSKNDTDYINASFIKGESGSRAYIATQGPLPHTVVDFFRMLWEYDVKVVVMACREFEMGKKKCELYWPKNQEEPFVCEPFRVYCDSEENKGDYLTRTLRLTYHDRSRILKQLHYVNWPDHGVPDSIPPILDMLLEMRSYQDHDDTPICIHCSAGCGRTGALCVIDYTWNRLKKHMITPDFSIYDLVQNMRTQRPSVVQTKEQYQLVYRTIKLLFQTYLQSADAQTCQNEVTTVPSATTESVEFDLLPQYVLDEEMDVFPQCHTSLPSASKNLIDFSTEDMQMDQPQWRPARTPPVARATAQDLNEGPRASPKLMHTTQTAPSDAERIKESDDIPSLNPPLLLPPPPPPPPPPPAVAATIRQMVEDPYFDTPSSTPSSRESAMDPCEATEEWTLSPIFNAPTFFLNDETLEFNSPATGAAKVHADEEAPPPLPTRTPESYVLVEDAELSDPCERLLVIPPNAAAEAVRELRGSTPSPVPPLPERTPESFEWALDQAPVEQKLEVKPAVNLNMIGKSSEWSGHLKPTCENETKTFVRSKSLKAKMTFTAPVTRLDLASKTTSNFQLYSPPLDPPTPPPPSQTQDSLTPPLPDRTPESFILTTEEIQEKSPLCPQTVKTTLPPPKVGMSSEWDGTSQPNSFLDVVMSRSKSVRAKSSRQEPLTAVQQLTPLPVVVAGGGSAQVEELDVNRRTSFNTERSGNQSDKSNEKGISRTRSLKFFKNKQKPKTSTPPSTQPGAAPQSNGAISSVFKFGFGIRFGKPKGPRTYPESWF
ncbi:tyrosine-protein phosphatase non-receptor type 22 [Embiotoca jacksoni]|uniref:tyrosine-protein phosphatase non-receptor type 22 n=1 Tax=Embiotoca jacksoni TaxID=100190 RepID=UPI003704AFD2